MVLYIRTSFDTKVPKVKYLMVRGSVDGAETVEACLNALVDSRGHDSGIVRSTVNTLELINWSE